MSTSRRSQFITTAIAAGFLSVPGVSAQVQLEEVMVTAQRRAESLQDVPVSVSALNAELIRDADITNLADVATRVPSLTFSPFAPGQTIISLRGVSSNDDGAGTDNSVAVFLDDVYIGGVAAIDFDLFDLESVEVLRGPQGTLFGKNAIGGVINNRSTKPDTEAARGRLEATLGNYKQRNIRGFVSGPLHENLAGKLTFSSRQNDGFVKNIVLNKRQKDQDVQSVRGQLLYHRDDFEALFTTEFTTEDVEDMGRIPAVNGSAPLVDIHRALGGDRDHVTNPIDGFSDRESIQFSLRMARQFDSGELLSITGYRDFSSRWHMDSTGVAYDTGVPPNCSEPGDTSCNLDGVNDDIDEEVEAFSQEFRWASNLDGAYNFVAGLFYLNEKTHRIEAFHLTRGLGEQDVGAVDIGPPPGVSDQDNETNSYAAFGQFSWDLSDRLVFNFGARYTYEEKDIENRSEFGFIIEDNFDASLSENWNDLSLKGSLDYRVNEDVLVYASIAEGFKSGGFPAAPFSAEVFQPIDPEEALSYEVGSKLDLFDRLRVNASAYFFDYSDIQVQRFGDDCSTAGEMAGTCRPRIFGIFQTLNAGDAEVKGMELEFTWLVSDAFTLSGMYSYTDSAFDDGTVLINGAGDPQDISGQELNRTPDNKYSLSAEYVYPVPAGGELKARADYRYTDFNRQDIFADQSNQPSFGVADARISWVGARENWELGLWCKNLTDKEYIAHSYIVGPGTIVVFGPPRTWGVTGTWNF